MELYRAVTKIIPSKLRKKMIDVVECSNTKINPYEVVGFITGSTILGGILAGLFGAWILGEKVNNVFWIFLLSFTILVNSSIYLWMVLLTDRRAFLIERALPDALQLMSSNLRAGSTPDKALLLSSRPEFGPLQDEVETIGRKVTLGKHIGEALVEMSKRVKSKRLVRAVELINSGLASGGSLATLLQSTADDLKSQALLDKKIKATIQMYIIFIFSAASLIAPILYGLSSFLVDILRIIFSQIDIPSSVASSFPFKIQVISLSTEYLIFFIISFIIANNFMASRLLGLIGKGKEREGIKYFIPMVLLAIPIFLLARFVIKTLLGDLFDF